MEWNERNLTMMTDLYQLTMLYGYYKEGMEDKESVFDLFFRKNTNESAYAIFAGLEQVVDYLEKLHFSEDDIAYLRSLHLFDEGFFDLLRSIRFTGDLYSMPEGSVLFPSAPLIPVRAPIGQAPLIETALLNSGNHQTLIATKASRVGHAAGNGEVLEFGLRRAQGPDAGIYGARAAVIGGCTSTSNVLAAQLFGVPARGTHAHSWVMSFSDEISPFRAYARHFPDNCLLLVDTYDTLNSGVPNAITVFEELAQNGHRPLGIRLDSGDLAYLSKRARTMLNDAGFVDAKIYASNDLDEVLIRDLKAQGACIDVWGVGTRLSTGGSTPALGGVYKLSAEDVDGELAPRMKVSNTPEKTTNPGYKKVLRFYDRESNKAIADLIALEGETFDEGQPLRIYHPEAPWMNKVIQNFRIRELLIPIYQKGKRVYDLPSVLDIQTYSKQELSTFWEEYKRDLNPSVYKVDLSDQLYDLKQGLLHQFGRL